MDIMTHNGQTTNNVYDTGKATTYVYNYEEKMIQVSLTNGVSIVYNYDHEGKRIGKTMNGTTIDYYFDGDDLITEAQGTSILAYYTQGQGLLSQRRNNASYFYHYDGLGSTKALTDANQNVQSSVIYDAWGNILQSSGTITNPYLYVGEHGYFVDGDAGMYLLTQRWYNPIVGRFVVKASLSPSEEFYTPFLNNPINIVDPLSKSVQIKTLHKKDIPWWVGCLCDLNIFKIARCMGYAAGLLAEWERLRREYGYDDKFVHCVASCDLAKECGEDFARCAGEARERMPGQVRDPEDRKANEAGIDCAKNKKNCVSCCIDEKGYPPFGPNPRPRPKPQPMHKRAIFFSL